MSPNCSFSPDTPSDNNPSARPAQPDVKTCGLKIRPDGKLWVSTLGESAYAAQVKDCLGTGMLYWVQFDRKRFEQMMAEKNIPPEAREQFLKNLSIDDDSYFYPA
jgi:hypothetical protein